MTLANEPDSAARDAIVQRDLGNVLHPIVQHKQLERQQLAVAAEQMQTLAYYPHTGMNLPAASLAEQINGLLGGDNHVYFVNSGSEANEAGFKIARQYMKQEYPGEFRYKTIGRYWGYHGTTLGTPAAGGMGERKSKFEPLSGNEFVHVAPPYLPLVRTGVREELGDDDPQRGAGNRGRGDHRTNHERCRCGGPTRRVPAGGSTHLPEIRAAPACRRGH